MVNLSKSTPSGNIFLYSSYNIIIQSMQENNWRGPLNSL